MFVTNFFSLFTSIFSVLRVRSCCSSAPGVVLGPGPWTVHIGVWSSVELLSDLYSRAWSFSLRARLYVSYFPSRTLPLHSNSPCLHWALLCSCSNCGLTLKDFLRSSFSPSPHSGCSLCARESSALRFLLCSQISPLLMDFVVIRASLQARLLYFRASRADG